MERSNSRYIKIAAIKAKIPYHIYLDKKTEANRQSHEECWDRLNNMETNVQEDEH